ncbi:MAG: hypothetical protein LBB28_02795 [Synergistaceae bacterium]|jgi:hypothetical protein|nr:hypothetical protein [Synergistaceae bacterium]
MAQNDEKIWVVIEKGDGGAFHAVAYDNATDAEHYCMEMRERRGDSANIAVAETELKRREELMHSHDDWAQSKGMED